MARERGGPCGLILSKRSLDRKIKSGSYASQSKEKAAKKKEADKAEASEQKADVEELHMPHQSEKVLAKVEKKKVRGNEQLSVKKMQEIDKANKNKELQALKKKKEEEKGKEAQKKHGRDEEDALLAGWESMEPQKKKKKEKKKKNGKGKKYANKLEKDEVELEGMIEEYRDSLKNQDLSSWTKYH